jgi:maltose alpha-D-glucosyltransferase / alpha-amylase
VAQSTEWFRDEVMYAVQVRTFYDSNGDGIGDLRGVIDKLDYVERLGAGCLWLLPFFKGGGGDDGYDVIDHCDVDPRYGTLEDFDALVAEAKNRGLRVMIDLIADHTSNQHPWFEAARRDPRSRYRDYYIWSDEPIRGPDVGESIFPGEEKDVWTKDEVAGAYYYHRFYHFEPSLNNANPAVQEEIINILDFWCRRGVSGFRLDAASHIIEDKPYARILPDGHSILRQIHSEVRRRVSDALLLGEADVEAEQYEDYFDGGAESDLLKNFLLANYAFLSFAREQAEPLARAIEMLGPSRGKDGHFANYLRSFDELDLERLSDGEREEVYRVFAPDPEARIYGRGIRRRLAPMLNNDPVRIRMAMSLVFSMPGSPLVFWGEEIGLGDDLSLPGRQAVRLPMPWSDSVNAGFSTAPADRLTAPVKKDGPFGYRQLNVALQEQDPGSMLNFMGRLIRLRKSAPEIGMGRFEAHESGDPAILVHTMSGDFGRTLLIHNLAGSPRSIALPSRLADGLKPRLTNDASLEKSEGNLRVRLGRYGLAWLRSE